MPCTKKPAVALSSEQRRLVRENIGLVGVHLRRYVPRSLQSVGGQDRYDLFQEGCLGLVEAASTFRPERGIAFAAYALPRIHHAVSLALKRRNPQGPLATRRSAGNSDRHDPASGPRTVSLSRRLENSLPNRRSNPNVPAGETLGDRIGGKIQRAASLAREKVAAARAIRADRCRLVDILLEERILIPEETSRRPLRQIARDTGSSFARVVQTDDRLREGIRVILDADPEFQSLRKLARCAAQGPDQTVSDSIDRLLARTGAAEIVRRFRSAGAEFRDRLFTELLRGKSADLESFLRWAASALPAESRERLFRDST